jgi:hypothetical protein
MKKLVKESLFESEHQENEGAHYKGQLEEIVQMAKDLYSNLPEGDIPAWVGDKIVVSKEYLYAVKSWLHGEEEEQEGIEEGPNRKMDNEEDEDRDNIPSYTRSPRGLRGDMDPISWGDEPEPQQWPRPGYGEMGG